ncbi:MAG TPA: hypothetical protein VIJ26_06060, partial [Thermoanaerobaculia bacterium]
MEVAFRPLVQPVLREVHGFGDSVSRRPDDSRIGGNRESIDIFGRVSGAIEKDESRAASYDDIRGSRGGKLPRQPFQSLKDLGS